MILERNSSLGMQFRTCENFGDFADSKSSLNPQNSHKYKSHTANTRICLESNTTDSSESAYSSLREFALVNSWQSTIKINRTKCESLQKFLLRFAFAKSRVPFIFTDSNPPRESQQC